MKKIHFLVLCAVFACQPVLAGEFKDKDSLFTVNMPSGWERGRSDNPAVSLRIENGSSSIEFEKQEDALSDYYLKSGVNESVEAVKARGANFYGAEVNSVSMYGVNNAYYTAYSADGVNECAALFTYNSHSFALSAVNVGPELCRNILSTICKPGTVCAAPCSPYNCLAPNSCKAGKCVAPAPCSPSNCAAPKVCKNNRCINPPCSAENCRAPKTCISGKCVSALAKKPKNNNTAADNNLHAETNAEVNTSTDIAAELARRDKSSSEVMDSEGNIVKTSSEPEHISAVETAASATEHAVSSMLQSISSASHSKNTSLPKNARKPLPIMVWAVIVGLWLFGSFLARCSAKMYRNPVLPPPPAEVPPDFFFPFVIDLIRTPTMVQYNIVTRQRQRLYGAYYYKYVPMLVYPVAACVLFHIAWSVLAFLGKGDLLMAKLYAIPFGQYIAICPEAIFALFFIVGLVEYSKRKKVIELYDSRQTLMMRAAKEDSSYCIIRDGQGKEVAHLVKKSSSPRTWEFVDVDNNIQFTLKDDAPSLYKARKLFGYQGGALRSRYGIFEADRRAGYTFMDPSSANKFQIHMDFAFARIAHPAQMLVAILFVSSYEKDSWYPTIF